MKVLARTLFAAVLTLSATAAHAAWTPEERAELRKIGETAVLMQDVIHDLAARLPTMTDPRSTGTAFTYLHRASHQLFTAFGCAHGVVTAVSGCHNDARADQVMGMIRNLDAARTSSNNAANALVRLEQPALADRLRDLPLESFNSGLAFLDPAPASSPNVIGPHGDVKQSLVIIDQAQLYAHGMQADLLRALQLTSGGSINQLSIAIKESALALDRLFRIVSINADAAQADDESLALADSAQGSGLRPPEFFRTLLSVEYASSNFPLGTRILSYRTPRKGAAIHYQIMQRSAIAFVQSLPPDQIVRAWTATSDSGWAREFIIASSTSWRSLDQWMAATILFFRPPSPQPRR